MRWLGPRCDSHHPTVWWAGHTQAFSQDEGIGDVVVPDIGCGNRSARGAMAPLKFEASP